MTDSAQEQTSLHLLVVLGSPITAEATPGPDMKQRLDHCLKVWRETGTTATFSSIVVTGGNPQTYGSSGVKAEALVMRDYLVNHGGVAQDKVLVESHSVHTFHNALYTRQLLQEAGSTNKVKQITILTHDWHVQRAKICFQLVWCNEPNIELNVDAVQSDKADPEVTARMAKEARLVKYWFPICLREEQNSPSMPPPQMAMARLKELVPDREAEE